MSEPSVTLEVLEQYLQEKLNEAVKQARRPELVMTQRISYQVEAVTLDQTAWAFGISLTFP